MEFHERMAIAHDLHTFWNPVADDVVDEMLWALDLQPGAHVLDIACGSGMLLTRMAAIHEIRGVGVDTSPWALERARQMHGEMVPDADLAFVESDGKAYVPAGDDPLDVVCLVGASWVFGGAAATLAALHELVRPDGLVLWGEPYWLVDTPPPAYLAAEGLSADSYLDLPGLLDAAEAAGFRMLYQVVSTPQDWDRYEMLQSLSVDRWASAHPEHPDRDAVLATQAEARRTFLRHGRDTLGFTQMVLRRID